MQAIVDELAKFGPLPGELNADEVTISKFQTLLNRINQPISDDDARALVNLFGPDDCFGLAWTLLHIVETAPGWPISDALSGVEGEWADRLRQRATDKSEQVAPLGK